MKVEVKDFGFRRVVRVTINDAEPKWVHPDGPAPAQPHTGDTEEAATLGVTACKVCRLNHRTEEFYWDAEEMVVGLNEWGNPVHDKQPVVSTRTKKWGELLVEIEAGRSSSKGQKVVGVLPRSGVPVEPISRLVPEVYLEFEAQPKGEPKMDGEVASQEFTVLHFGVAKAIFTAQGATRVEFAADRDAKLQAAKNLIGTETAEQARAKTIAQG